jgi:hypothetical protein
MFDDVGVGLEPGSSGLLGGLGLLQRLGHPLGLVAIATGDGQFGLRFPQVLVEAAQPVVRLASSLAGKDLLLAVGAS